MRICGSDRHSANIILSSIAEHYEILILQSNDIPAPHVHPSIYHNHVNT